MPSSSIGELIGECYKYISQSDALRFTRKFRQQQEDTSLVRHTLSELVFGACLGRGGFVVKNNPLMFGKTPDWGILAADGEISCIVELVNPHPDHRTASSIRETLGKTNIWVGIVPEQDERIAGNLRAKALAYSDLIEKAKLPYVIGVVEDFHASVEPVEFELAFSLLDAEYPGVSGVAVLKENGGSYSLRYWANPSALRPFHIPELWFP